MRRNFFIRLLAWRDVLCLSLVGLRPQLFSTPAWLPSPSPGGRARRGPEPRQTQGPVGAADAAAAGPSSRPWPGRAVQKGPGAERKDSTHNRGADWSRERIRSGKGGEPGGAGGEGRAGGEASAHRGTSPASACRDSRPEPPGARPAHCRRLPVPTLRSPFSLPPGRGGGSASRMPGAEQEQNGARKKMNSESSALTMSSHAVLNQCARGGMEQEKIWPKQQQQNNFSLFSSTKGWNFRGKKRKQSTQDEDTISICSLDTSEVLIDLCCMDYIVSCVSEAYFALNSCTWQYCRFLFSMWYCAFPTDRTCS
ncbi:translation initiation factor IF-2-like [Motacilla alba alba]|uniref:translation initiation factor IF-2-like n=1 Tax=Motacilla alba alba TaxID=1094192 RepID=UPI0018D55CDD|nr:translation initiation factor IF-2-like [Motacilla alba alba]